MVNLQKFLSDKGLPSEDATTLRSQIRHHLKRISLENRLPPPDVRKLPYKPLTDAHRTPMDDLTDELRHTIDAKRIPPDVFASVVKMVLSSDISDMRQKERRERVKLDTARSAFAAAQVVQETAMVARSTGKVLYHAAKVGFGSLVVLLVVGRG